MKDREETIAFEMNYCQHYGRGRGADMICKAGVDLKTLKRVPVGTRGITWGPCIEGHTLSNPNEHCPHWIRRTREMGEKRADAMEKSMALFEKVMPVVAKWRTWTSTNRVSKFEVIDCPTGCGGKLHLSQSSYNGHVHGKCSTPNCVAWVE